MLSCRDSVLNLPINSVENSCSGKWGVVVKNTVTLFPNMKHDRPELPFSEEGAGASIP